METRAAEARRNAYEANKAAIVASIHLAQQEFNKLNELIAATKDPGEKAALVVERDQKKKDLTMYRAESSNLDLTHHKEESASSAKIRQTQVASARDAVQHEKDVADGWIKAKKDLDKMEKQLSDNAIDRASATAQAQIDSFQQTAEAALEKAQLIENAADREKAVNEVLTRLAKNEAALRANILKTMRESYQSEFGQMFDFMKEMGAMSKEMTESMRDAVEQEIVSLVHQRGAAALASGEGARLLATYKKIQDELNPKKGQSTGIGLGASWDLGAIHDDKGSVISKSLFDDDLDKHINPSMQRLKDKIGSASLSSMEHQMKDLVRSFTGENGLAQHSEHLGNRFRDLASTVSELNKNMAAMMADVKKQGNSTAPTVKEKEKRKPASDDGMAVGAYREGAGSYGTFTGSDGKVIRMHDGKDDSFRGTGPSSTRWHHDPSKYNQPHDPRGQHSIFTGHAGGANTPQSIYNSNSNNTTNTKIDVTMKLPTANGMTTGMANRLGIQIGSLVTPVDPHSASIFR